jgi:hypothetical protein
VKGITAEELARANQRARTTWGGGRRKPADRAPRGKKWVGRGKNRRLVDNEETLQIRLFQHLAHPELVARHPEVERILHVPNGGNRPGKEGAFLKAAGVKAGFPDVLWPYRLETVPGIAIEMKAEEGVVSDAQQEWREYLRSQGWDVHIVFDEPISRADEYAFNLLMIHADIPFRVEDGRVFRIFDR